MHAQCFRVFIYLTFYELYRLIKPYAIFLQLLLIRYIRRAQYTDEKSH
jgi:hypothetical protein